MASLFDPLRLYFLIWVCLVIVGMGLMLIVLAFWGDFARYQEQ